MEIEIRKCDICNIEKPIREFLYNYMTDPAEYSICKSCYADKGVDEFMNEIKKQKEVTIG